MATFDEFYQSLPEDSNKRGEFFEKVFVPWFLRTDPEWSSKVKQIWLWNEYPQRWGTDCGIDLVYEDKQGKHWAVQSKCVSPDREISKAEIDSFLSESNDQRIHGRLLIASTDGIGRNALQVIKRQEKQIVCFLREHFRQSEVEFPSTPKDLATGRRKDKRRPRPHQQEAIQNVVAGLQWADRGQLLMACGTGKTLTSLWIKEALNAKRTLVLLPSLSLLSQTLREWTAASRTEFNWICVCSDKSVVKQDKTVDDWIESVSELGVPVTSDPSEIRTFLLENEEGIVFSTYQSSPLVAEAQQEIETPSFDIAFADEAHRCAGKVSPAFGCILDSQKIRAENRLFMTATPRVLSNQIKSRADAEDIEIASMDDEEQFGRVFHRLNFSEAIERDLLTDYRVIVVGVDDPSIQAKIINRHLSSTGTGVETDYETLANHISLSKSVRDYNLQRIITFHGRVKAAQKFSEDHPKVVDWLLESSPAARSIKTGYVSGEMTSLERNSKINKLHNLEKDEIGILSNARCLSEGVDVPTLDGIAFIDPRNSQVDIIQAVGRAIRKSESKSFGYIILPVYLGETENISEELLASRFKDVWEIILALKSQDDSLTEILDRLRVELGKRGERASDAEGLTKIIFDLPEQVESTIGDSLQTVLVRNTTESWDEQYGRLLAYIERHGDANPPRSHPKLGLWVVTQRSNFQKGTLNKRKRDLLNSLTEQGWVWRVIEERWQKRFDELKEYVMIHGQAQPPDDHATLGIWVQNQRQKFKRRQIEKDKIKALEDLNGWTWDVKQHRWDLFFQRLEAVGQQSGNIQFLPDDSVDLKTWIKRQKSLYKGGRLNQEQIDKLETLRDYGWTWEGDRESYWREKYDELLKYTDKYGHACPPVQDSSLGTWVDTQRQYLKQGRLQEDRKELLDKLIPLGWKWNTTENRQQEWLKKISEYLAINGHLVIPDTGSEFSSIAKMVRAAYQGKGKYHLDQEVKAGFELLQKDGWMWNYNKEVWEEKVFILSEWCIQNNSYFPPKGTMHPGNPKTFQPSKNTSEFDLQSFANSLRAKYRLAVHRNNPEYSFSGSTLKQKDLTRDEIDFVEQTIPGWYWNSFDGFCKTYKECLDRGLVVSSQTIAEWATPELKNIGSWKGKIRSKAKSDVLKQHELSTLKDLGII